MKDSFVDSDAMETSFVALGMIPSVYCSSGIFTLVKVKIPPVAFDWLDPYF